MLPQNPFRCNFIITQKFRNKSSNYINGYHLGTDFLPLDKDGKAYPAEIYPIFDGSEILIADESTIFGKGVKERTELDQEFINYLKDKGLVPKDHQDRVQVELFYWHMLKVLDKDGVVSKDIPMGLAGNTGYVFSAGVEVPNEQKGVPPYPGLHTHIEAVIRSGNTIFNKTDDDPNGRVDVEIILNYKKEKTMNSQTKVVLSKNSDKVWICQPVPSIEYLTTRASLEGFEVPQAILSGDKANSPTTDTLS